MKKKKLKDSLIVDSTFAEFDQFCTMAKKSLYDLYDVHDREKIDFYIKIWSIDSDRTIKVREDSILETIQLEQAICNKYKGEK